MLLRSISLRVLAIAFIAIGLRTGAAEAAVITYNNLASWQAAVSGVNTTTFEENASGAFTSYGLGPAAFGGGTYTINAGQLFTVGDSACTTHAQNIERHGLLTRPIFPK